jgi:hypothetical protein
MVGAMDGTTIEAMLAAAKDAIVRVGEGRGFLLDDAPWPQLVITAAHCLPRLPPADPGSYAHERTYRNLLGPIGVPPTVWAECVFVDPIADLAVLASPDGQTLVDECDAYEQFVEGRPALRIGEVDHSCPVWLLTLSGVWHRCNVEVLRRSLTLVGPKEGNAPGASGSPILMDDGRAIGIVNVGTETNGKSEERQGGQTRLMSCLPGWMLAKLHAKGVAQDQQ